MSRPGYRASPFFFLFSKTNNLQIEVLQATKETSQVVYNIQQESCSGQISCRANASRAQMISVSGWNLPQSGRGHIQAPALVNNTMVLPGTQHLGICNTDKHQ